MLNGILIVDKPADWTSHDVVGKLRGLLRERRIGHGGTLDPMATGVLPVFIGKATRGVQFAVEGDKEYRALLRLGTVTDTQDTTGTVLEERPVTVGPAELETVLARFRGNIEQIPPMYSAIKVKGQPLYKLARRGETVDRDPRPVTIRLLEQEDWEAEGVRLHVVCSKGTYVRTLCHDIGAALGCGGCMAALRRTRAGRYGIEQAHSLEEILAAPDTDRLLLPVDSLFDDRPALTVNASAERKLRNGAVVGTLNAVNGEYRVYGPAGDFLLLGEVKNGELRTVRSFFEA